MVKTYKRFIIKRVHYVYSFCIIVTACQSQVSMLVLLQVWNYTEILLKSSEGVGCMVFHTLFGSLDGYAFRCFGCY